MADAAASRSDTVVDSAADAAAGPGTRASALARTYVIGIVAGVVHGRTG